MPRPPDIGAFADMKFITNYFLAGCSPPFHLFIEFSQAPAKALLMLFLIPDLEDIGQAIFDPKAGRRRKPARHGRKRRRVPGVPDVSDIIGHRVRAEINPYNALDFGPVNKAFRIWNKYEALSFTCAVIEGLTNVGFEGLWGVLKSDPNHCKDFHRLCKIDEDFFIVGGVGPPLQGVAIDTVEFNNGFNNSLFTCRSRFGEYTVNFNAFIFNYSYDVTAYGSLALQDLETGEIYRSPPFELGPREGTSRQVNAKFPGANSCAWGVADMFNFVAVGDRSIVAYDIQQIPWPL